MKFWHVYRDGGLYLSHATDPIDAADLTWLHKTDTDLVRLLGRWAGPLRIGPHFIAYAYQSDRLRGTVALLVDLRAGTVIVDKRVRLREVDVLAGRGAFGRCRGGTVASGRAYPGRGAALPVGAARGSAEVLALG